MITSTSKPLPSSSSIKRPKLLLPHSSIKGIGYQDKGGAKNGNLGRQRCQQAPLPKIQELSDEDRNSCDLEEGEIVSPVSRQKPLKETLEFLSQSQVLINEKTIQVHQESDEEDENKPVEEDNDVEEEKEPNSGQPKRIRFSAESPQHGGYEQLFTQSNFCNMPMTPYVAGGDFLDGPILPQKRGRGRPRKTAAPSHSNSLNKDEVKARAAKRVRRDKKEVVDSQNIPKTEFTRHGSQRPRFACATII